MGYCFTANSLYIQYVIMVYENIFVNVFFFYSNDAAKLPLLYYQSDKTRVLSFKYTEKLDIFKFSVRKKECFMNEL